MINIYIFFKYKVNKLFCVDHVILIYKNYLLSPLLAQMFTIHKITNVYL